MEDSLKGSLWALTIIGLFITAIFSFIVIFPQEQGVTFSGGNQHTYLTINETATNSYQSTVTNLEAIEDSSNSAYNDWDITVGFLGTNPIKQGSSNNVKSYSANIMGTLKTIATQIFGSGSPVIYALTVITTFIAGYLIYVFIKFVRTGL